MAPWMTNKMVAPHSAGLTTVAGPSTFSDFSFFATFVVRLA